MYRQLLELTFFLLLSVVVFAEGNGEITQPSSDTLIMSWDTNRTWINESPLAWSNDGMPGELYETDSMLGVEYYIQNKNFFRLTLLRNPNIPANIDYPVYYCSYMPVIHYTPLNYTYDRCPDSWYSYYLGTRKASQSINIRIPPGEYSAFAWWIGDGAGGGGGLPVCEGVTISASYNQTQGEINFQFRMGGKLNPIGGFTAGCTPLMLMWQDYEGSWGQIDSTNTSNYLDCDSKQCRNNSPGWSWDYRNINCDKAGSVNVRMYGTYIYRTRQYATWTATQAITCNAPPVPEPEGCPSSVYNWNITNHIICENINIEVNNTLLIWSNASLTLNNASLVFKSVS